MFYIRKTYSNYCTTSISSFNIIKLFLKLLKYIFNLFIFDKQSKNSILTQTMQNRIFLIGITTIIELIKNKTFFLLNFIVTVFCIKLSNTIVLLNYYNT